MSQNCEKEFQRLEEIISRLRGQDGCPWDKKQTHASLREFLLEETYEALEALDEGDYRKLCQELGDLLLQIMLHSQIAAENGEFKIHDVLKALNDKLVRRHPHVFGDLRVENADEVSHNWEAIKKGERDGHESMLDTVPNKMPALAYSMDIQRRVQQVGFDWENIEGVIDKLVEEVNELRRSEGAEERADEFGDMLFTLVNVARRLGIDPEASLRKANRKFYLRFAAMENLSRERGLDLGKLTFEEQNRLWEEAKKTVSAKISQ